MISTGAISLSITNGHNAIAKHQTHSNSINSTSIPQRNTILFQRQKVAPVMAVMTSKHPVRLRELTEDEMSYKERFKVRYYEVGNNKTVSLETMADLLQEVAVNHAKYTGLSSDGYPCSTTMRKLHLVWVNIQMHIEIYRYPTWSDVVEIETWSQWEGRIRTRRDWIFRDCANGEVIGRATSKLVLLNEDTRRLEKASDDIIREYLAIFPTKLSPVLLEENSNMKLKKIGKLEDPAKYSKLGIVPRRVDLDINKHVNNVTYISWVLESIPQEVIDTHDLQSITLDYKRECQHDDIVDSLATPEPINVSRNKSIASKQDGEKIINFLHSLRSSSDGLEINRCRTQWRKKPVK